MKRRYFKIRVWLGLVVAAAAVAVPVAQARHAPGEDGSASVPPASVWIASSLEVDRLGPKHVALSHPYSGAPVEASAPGPTVSVTNVLRPGGFDWGDAGIGAGVSSLTLALLAGLALLLTRRSQRKSVTERTELAGT
jgi:hypothetical protein